jgi:short-subunit dehydrogenase
VRAFTESLRAQLVGTPITASEAAPGPVESEFDQTAGIEGDYLPAALFPNHRPGMRDDMIRKFERGSPVIFPGWRFRWLMRVQPLQRPLVTQIAQAASKIRNARLMNRP